MRICILGNAASIHTVRWANGLGNLGNEVFLLSASPPKVHQLNPKVQVQILRYRPPLGYFLNIRQVRTILKDINPDILNTHYASGYGTLSRFIGFKPTLLSVWGSDIFDVPYQNPIYRNIVYKNLKAATRLASTSHVMKREIEKLFYPAEEIFVTPFGVDLIKFKPGLKKEDQVITIGIIKRIMDKYGQIYLVKAVKLVVDRLFNEGYIDIAERIRLLIVGDGPQRKEIERLIQHLGMDSICTLTGEIEHSKVPDYLHLIDICCFPSTLASESFGVSIIEASACEIPVIASNLGGLPEVIKDGETGYLVRPMDEFDLAEKIYQLVINPELREKMGVQGRQFVSQHYDWQENLQRMEHFMTSVVDDFKQKQS